MSCICIAKALRRVSNCSHFAKRYNSTVPSQPKPNYTLSPEKLRALISLYHQTDTFITKENLSERIDQAFIQKDLKLELMTGIPGMKALKEEVQRRRAAPKFSEHDMETGQGPSRPGEEGTWSSNLTLREWKVVEALYGVDSSDMKRSMPGLESLEEWSESKEDEVVEEDWTKLLQKEAEEEQKQRMEYNS
jgi:hypothetical protein